MNALQRARACERLDFLLGELRASMMQSRALDWTRMGAPEGPETFVGRMQARLECWQKEIASIRALLTPAEPPAVVELPPRPDFDGVVRRGSENR